MTKKIGMIFECGPQGADKAVCTYLAKNLRGDIEISCVTLDNKANLLRDAGKAAAGLLRDGCCCVLVLWDLRPAWPTAHAPCRVEESAAVRKSLQDAGVKPNAAVHPICIEQELESWLLANERAVSAFLSTPTHKFSMPRKRHPDRVPQPKAVMIGQFKQARGWRYVDTRHALGVLCAAPINVQRLRRSASFCRFEQKLLGC